MKQQIPHLDPKEKSKVQYVGLDVLNGENVDFYFGIIKGEIIIAIRAGFEGCRKEVFDVIYLRLDNTVNLVPFIYGVLYRRIQLDSTLGYKDPRIIKKFSAKAFKKEVNKSTYQDVLNVEKQIIRGLINGTLKKTPYYT